MGACCRLAREPVGVLLCSRSSQSSSGLAGFIVSVAELADALDLGSSAFGRVGSTPTGRTSGRGFRSFLLPLALHSCYDGWDVARRVSSIWQNTSLVNWVLGVRVPHPALVLTVARERATVETNREKTITR